MACYTYKNNKYKSREELKSFLIEQQIQFSVKPLGTQDKVHGFYDQNTKQTFLTEEFLSSKSLMHEFWHASKNGIKNSAKKDKTAELLLKTMNNLVKETGFNEQQVIERYNNSNKNGLEINPMIIGRPNSKFKLAEKLEKEGKTSKEIFLKTGWERGKDNKWRVEIPNGKYIKLPEIDGITGEGDRVALLANITEVLDSPKMFEIFPELKTVSIYFQKLDANLLGIAIPEKNTILIDKDLEDGTVYTTLLHEIQHFLQSIEGLSTGGNVDNFIRAENKKLKRKPTEAEAREIEQKAIESYKRLAGEVEARNVETRSYFSEEQRRLITLSESEDRPRSIQTLNSNEFDFMIVGENGANNIQTYKDLLEQAKGLDRQSKDYSNTGWFKNENNEWKYFSNEYVNQFKFKKDLNLNKEQNFEDVIEDNIIFQVYPESKKLKIVLYDNRYSNPLLEKGISRANGAYSKDQNTIFVNIKNTDGKSAEHIIGHELNHFAQGVEGFSTGGNTLSLLMYALNSTNYDKNINPDIREYVKNYDRTTLSKNDIKIFDNAIKIYDAFNKNEQDRLYNYYQRIEGEIDSRAVELAISIKNKYGSVKANYEELKNRVLKVDNISLDQVVSLYYKGFEYNISKAYSPRQNESENEYVERMREEVEANLLGENSVEYFNKIAEENKLTDKEKSSLINKVKAFIKKFSDWLSKQLGFENLTPEQASKLTNKEVLDRVTTSILNGQFKEVDSNTLLRYITNQNKSQEQLTKEQIVDLQDFNSFDKDKLLNTFYDDNGIFSINEDKLNRSKIYKPFEVSNIVRDVQLQATIKDSLERLKNTEVDEFLLEDVEATRGVINEFNSFGKMVTINSFLSQKNKKLDVLYTLKDPKKNTLIYVDVSKLLSRHRTDAPSYDITKQENQIGNRVKRAKEYLESSAVNFEPSVVYIAYNKLGFEDGRHRVLAAKELGYSQIGIEVPKEQAIEIEKLLKAENYKDAQTFVEINGEIRQRKNTETELLLPITAKENENTKIEDLLRLRFDTLQENIEETRDVLNQIEDDLIKDSIDVIGLSEKPIDENLINYLTVLNNFIKVPTVANSKAFADLSDEYFERDLSPKKELIKGEQNKEYVKLETTLSEEEVYNQQGLIKLDDTTYIKTAKESLETLYENLRTYTEKYPKDKTLEEYVQEQLKDYTYNNAEIAEAVILYKMYFGVDIKKLKVYHGTNKVFDKFDLEKRGSNTGFSNTKFGFFFLQDRQLAENFAKEEANGNNVIEANIVLNNPVDLTIQGIFTNKKQAPAIVEILTGEIMSEKKALNFLDETIGLGEMDEFRDSIEIEEGRNIFIKYGFDGVISDFGAGSLEYIVFTSEQINILNQTQKPTKQTSKFTGDYNYLTENYPSDFYSKFLAEKKLNSKLFRNFYSNFEINEKGIKLINTDEISLRNIKIYADENLKQYSLLSKQMIDFSDNIQSIENPRDNAINNPKTIETFTGQLSKLNQNEVIVKNNSQDFINIGGEIFESYAKEGSLNHFVKLESNNSDYYAVNVEAPQSNINLKDYNYLNESLDKFIEYSKGEEVEDFKC